ncbi:MAG: amidase [Flavobacteriaceae bacterium]
MCKLKLKITLILSFFIIHGCQKTNKIENLNDFIYLETTIENLIDGYKNGDIKAVEVIKEYIHRIKKIDMAGPNLRSIIQINPDAVKIASELDNLLAKGKLKGPLHGIPVILKDNIDTGDKMNTTAGSRALINSKAIKDAFIVKKIRESGAIILGKANLSEWANFRGQNSTSGWSGINGQTKNPYVLTRNPCGSSSGSGVAVSANLTVLAIGTETNGSIMCPSNANGIVGIKPTVGLISRTGIIPISFTQDTSGPMARTLTDAVITLNVMIGKDSLDSKTLSSKSKKLDYTNFLRLGGIKNKRIGVYSLPLGNKSRRKGYNADVDILFKRSIKLIRSLGAEIIEIDTINHRDNGIHSYNVMLHEYKDGLNKYFKTLKNDSRIKNLDDLIEFNEKDSIELKYFNQAYLKLANKTGGMKSDKYKNSLFLLNKYSKEEGIDRVMNKYNLDAIISPTGSPAWSSDLLNGDNYHIGSSSPAARAGYPNITIPMGNVHGLPIGISFFGRAWSESKLIEIAFDFEQISKARIIPNFKLNDEHL